jgi:hypothetical protein
MEGGGVLNIINYSLHTQGIGICYTKYLGDADHKSCQLVVPAKQYDSNIGVTKL